MMGSFGGEVEEEEGKCSKRKEQETCRRALEAKSTVGTGQANNLVYGVGRWDGE